MKIGFIGLGIMGQGMASNLVKNGLALHVYNRTKQKAEPLIQQGAVLAGNTQALARQSDIIFLMLSDDKACDDVAGGDAGLLSGLDNTKTVVNLSTVSPAYSQSFNEKVKQTGARFLEAPVVGSKIPAQNATLIILAAGGRQVFDAVEPYLEKMGKKTFYLGGVPNASYLKVVNNHVMGITMMALAEGMSMAKKIGLDLNAVYEVLNAGGFASPLIAAKGKGILNGNFDTNFPYKHMQKDLGFAVRLAEDFKCFCPALSAVNDAFKKGLHEHGDEDMSAIYRVLE